MQQHRTATFFDRYAHDFNAIYGNANSGVNSLVNKLFRESMRLRYLMTLDGCRPLEGRSVLDIGCGPGHFSVALAKRGAARVLGVDFAESMVSLAKRGAEAASVAETCSFKVADFMTSEFNQKFDFAIVMGFIDYMANPRAVVERVLSLTKHRAFFSFPIDGGLLAWQRKLRYRARCELFLYSEKQVKDLFRGTGWVVKIDRIDRDFFVAAERG